MKTIPFSLLALVATATGVVAQPQRRPPADPATAECAVLGQLPAAWEGQAFAVDGDTLAGAGLKAPIRIWGIRAPELRDDSKSESVTGMRARAALEDLLAGSDHKVKCRPARYDRDCRIVAQCSLTGESIDVGGAMIAAGMAYGFELGDALPWEARASQRYADSEFQARKARRGLWSQWLGEK